MVDTVTVMSTSRGKVPVGAAVKTACRLVREAATAELVVLTDLQRFTDDLEHLSNLTPDLRWALGERPTVVGVVHVALEHDLLGYAVTLAGDGTGVYAKFEWSRDAPPAMTFATDVRCGAASVQAYSPVCDGQ